MGSLSDFLKKFFFSTRLMSILFIVFAVAMAFGTFIESWYSTETARIWIYNATWFEAIMVIFVINFIGNISRYRLFRKEKWAVLLLHLSWILIIVGAFVTRYISFEGLMPIREGATERVFYSDKTFLTVLVDGKTENGELQRKTLQNHLIVTPEAIKSDLPWNSDFKGQDFSIAYDGFIAHAKKGLVADPNGKNYLKIVEAGDGSRHEHFLEEGQVANIHNMLFALNKETQGAINIFLRDTVAMIKSPFEGNFMRMADQLKGELKKDSIQPLMMRSLYTVGNMRFVLPEPLMQGKYDIIPIPKAEQTKNDMDGFSFSVTSNGETVKKTILGSAGTAEFSEPFTVGGLDFRVSFGSKVYQLPFGIKLNDFIAERYPGTERGYSSYMSKITVNDERPFDYDIYMNHVLDHHGYRFFQSSFHPDEKGTVLSVSHDFWGTWITYIGYFLLYLGLMGIMFPGKTRFRELGEKLKKVKEKKKALLLLAMTLGTLSVWGQHTGPNHMRQPSPAQLDSMFQASIVPKEHADKFARLVIQDGNGRMKPINTFASEVLRKLRYENKYEDLNPDQVMLSMMIVPSVWIDREFIVIDRKGYNDSLRNVLGLPKGKEFLKLTDVYDDKVGYKLSPFLEDAYSTTNPNKFQKDYQELDLRLGLFDQALSGSILKIFPLLDDENNKWISANEFRMGTYQVKDSLYANFINNALPYYVQTLKAAKISGDYAEADKLLAAFAQNQKNHGGAVLPSDKKIDVEIRYNRIDIFNKLYRYYGLFGLLMFLFVILQIFKDRKFYRGTILGFKGIIWLLFLLHTAGLIARWYISGHAPWSDAYESILYVSWASMGMGLMFARKSDMTVAATAFATTLLLWVAHQSWVDPEVANLQPVLNSYWLMIHVAIIVGSYGPLTVGMILGVVAMLLMIMTNKKNKKRMELNLQELTIINELTLTLGLVLLTIGNFLGGQWANESWGRYWGWDPKETWALISIMVYAFVIHARLVPGLRSRWLYSFMSVVAYASIMMTYFGVNFYLVGLHSYASGAQVITPTLVYYIVAFVFALGGLSYWRYRVHYKK
ncbi:cytochrome c biogenesis protein CcsA [Sediminicola luteus]|nr:cytochrome c biogenesis protein CcsA [Sediminicola luteus]